MPSIWVSNSDIVDCLPELGVEHLIGELEDRGYTCSPDNDVDDDVKEIVDAIHNHRRLGQDYQKMLDELIWKVCGKYI